MFCSAAAIAQDAKPYAITSVEPLGNTYIISYFHNPIGDEPDAEYEVSLRLLRESDRKFNVPLKFVSGNVGDGKFTGSKLRIVWDFKKEFPNGLPYDDIVFELTITKNEGGGTWYYYVGGAAVIGAGAFFLLKPGKEETSNSALPDPPSSRPF